MLRPTLGAGGARRAGAGLSEEPLRAAALRERQHAALFGVCRIPRPHVAEAAEFAARVQLLNRRTAEIERLLRTINVSFCLHSRVANATFPSPGWKIFPDASGRRAQAASWQSSLVGRHIWDDSVQGRVKEVPARGSWDMCSNSTSESEFFAGCSTRASTTRHRMCGPARRSQSGTRCQGTPGRRRSRAPSAASRPCPSACARRTAAAAQR